MSAINFNRANMKTTELSENMCEKYLQRLVGSRHTPQDFVSKLNLHFSCNGINLELEKEGKLPTQDDSYLFTIEALELFADVTMWFLPTKTDEFYITEVSVSYE